MTAPKSIMDRILLAMESTGERRTFSKGAMIITEGQVERNIYLVETGAVRAFLLTASEEQTIRFGYKGSIINSLASFINGKPSELYIEAIRKTTLKSIDKEAFTRLVQEDRESLQQYVALLELLVTQQIDREIDILTASPIERLKRVLARSPNLFQEIPLKYIASYLRMTPETLSRIRNS